MVTYVRSRGFPTGSVQGTLEWGRVDVPQFVVEAPEREQWGDGPPPFPSGTLRGLGGDPGRDSDDLVGTTSGPAYVEGRRVDSQGDTVVTPAEVDGDRRAEVGRGGPDEATHWERGVALHWVLGS